ncbi:peptidoglycan DD-metalloendopeptidase family protein [Micrococcus luteus]|uniref:peptidoglycan DD-metalloendopeptidase family protein n=1 Tax=Micrococcaceae TaxID=1268 RepID=UPI00332B26FD
MAARTLRRTTAAAVMVIVIVMLLVIALIMGMIVFLGGAEQARRAQTSSWCNPAQAGVMAGNGIAVPAVGLVTSGFGQRDNPFSSGQYANSDRPGLTNHTAVDIGGMPMGAPIYTALDGTVSVVTLGGQEKGNGVLIDSGGGVQILYWHMANDTITVREGQTVKAGQQIGGAGDTGVARGVHLHMDVRVNGEHVDPAEFFRPRGLILELRQPVRLAEGAGGSPGGAGGSAGPSSASSGTASVRPAGASVSGSSAQDGAPDPSVPVRITLPEGIDYTLKPEQVRNAATIIGVGRDLGVSDQAIIVALMTAMQESMLYVLASAAVPESLSYPHDRLGVNKDSVNLFQQRTSTGWGSVSDIMNPEYATRAFFGGPTGPLNGYPRGLLDVPGWEGMRPGVAAQTVQMSGHPDGYHKWESAAGQVLGQVTGTAPVGCQGPAVTAADQASASSSPGALAAADEGSQKLAIPAGTTRQDVVVSAGQGVGQGFVYGQADFGAWDASGFVYWAYRDAGVPVPRTNPWSAGVRTETPQPGDLVAQQWDPQRRRWKHVGIYTGDGMMISAINESADTRKHPVTQTGEDTVYFDLFQEKP